MFYRSLYSEGQVEWEKGAQYVIESGLNWLFGKMCMTLLKTTVRLGQSVWTGIDETLAVRSTLYWLLEVLITPK